MPHSLHFAKQTGFPFQSPQGKNIFSTIMTLPQGRVAYPKLSQTLQTENTICEAPVCSRLVKARVNRFRAAWALGPALSCPQVRQVNPAPLW